MNIRIYQVNLSRDKNNIAFMSYEQLPRFQGSQDIDSSLYDKVFGGEVECNNLEDVYVMFNQNHPNGYKARSLSKSDIVEIIGKDGKSEFHYCDSVGFKKVDFEPEKTKLSERYLDLSKGEKIKILFVPVGKYPKVVDCPNTYEGMKNLVGGGLDEYMPFDENIALVCNREGKMNNLPMNRAVYYENSDKISDIIHGDFFIANANVDAEKYESLTPEQIEKYRNLFKYPERFTETEHGYSVEKYTPQRTDRER